MRVAVAGAGGRMGRTLIEEVQKDGELSLAAALDIAPGTAPGGVPITLGVDAALAAADVLIDFTRPAGTLLHLEACARLGKAIVIGTTGFSEAEKQRIALVSRSVPVFVAPNFAIGVNVLFELAEVAARALGDAYDVEIIEAHHHHKVDAPSGTALKLGEIVAHALGRDLAGVAAHGRAGEPGERPPKEIGFHAIRGGDIVGEHTVLFAGIGERVEVTVRSQSRATYATGALRAAKYLKGRANGLYGMKDLLGLR